MRGLIALLLIAAIVAAVGFLADRPGHVEIVWQGWQIETSVAVLAAAVALLLLVVSLLVLAAATAYLTAREKLPHLSRVALRIFRR